jgi:hypothetical protein
LTALAEASNDLIARTAHDNTLEVFLGNLGDFRTFYFLRGFGLLSVAGTLASIRNKRSNFSISACFSSSRASATAFLVSGFDDTQLAF